MQQVARAYSALEQTHSESTTLRELIEAINEEVPPEKDHLVAQIVLDLLDTGRIKFINPMGELALF